MVHKARTATDNIKIFIGKANKPCWKYLLYRYLTNQVLFHQLYEIQNTILFVQIE